MQTVFNELRQQCVNAASNPVRPIRPSDHRRNNCYNFIFPFSKLSESLMTLLSDWSVCMIFYEKIG